MMVSVSSHSFDSLSSTTPRNRKANGSSTYPMLACPSGLPPPAVPILPPFLLTPSCLTVPLWFMDADFPPFVDVATGYTKVYFQVSLGAIEIVHSKMKFEREALSCGSMVCTYRTNNGIFNNEHFLGELETLRGSLYLGLESTATTTSGIKQSCNVALSHTRQINQTH